METYVKAQIDAGLDEVNDGEAERGIYFGNISELPGFAQGAYPMAWPSGDVIGTPVVVAPIVAPAKPLAAREVERTRNILSKLGISKTVKVTVPSVSMMSYFYSPFAPVQGYSRDSYLAQVKDILVAEAKAAFAAGARVVQFDAPTLFIAKPEERADLVALDNELLDSVAGLGTRQLHACWGNYWNTQVDSETPLADPLGPMLELRTDVLGPLEVSDGVRDAESLRTLTEVAGSFSAKLAAGILSVKSRNVEPVSVLKQRIGYLDTAYDGRLLVSNGCGFASNPESIHSFESAKRKLTNLCKAADLGQ